MWGYVDMLVITNALGLFHRQLRFQGHSFCFVRATLPHHREAQGMPVQDCGVEVYVTAEAWGILIHIAQLFSIRHVVCEGCKGLEQLGL